MSERFQKQVAFIVEVDKLKQVYRRTPLIDRSRMENDAEHSWHLALIAILFSEYAIEKPLDILRVLKMVLIHDLVEIDAGDTYLYDEEATKDKAKREQQAADRIFGGLPEDQAGEFRRLWEEFEARHTPEAKFAAALDRFQPLLHNYHTEGVSWKHHGVTSDKVVARVAHMQEGSPLLWEYAQSLIQCSVEKGYLAP